MDKKILHFIWGLPQNLVGAIMYFVLCKKNPHKPYKQAFVCEMPNKWGSVSLGMFIFVQDIEDENTIKHEYGHTIQSMILGVSYLLVVGLPSILWAGFGDEYREKNNVSYYSFITEKWADKFGGVIRLKGD